MAYLQKLLKDVGLATFGNVIGRMANVLIPFAVIGTCGVDRLTDTFFLVLAVAFFFFGTIANALTDASVPLIASGRLALSRPHVYQAGIVVSILVLIASAVGHLFWQELTWPYFIGLALLSGAGIANGLSCGLHLYQERFGLPGASWIVRLAPITLFILMDSDSRDLPWLAVGIGLADGVRLLFLTATARFSTLTAASGERRPLGAVMGPYALVLVAATLMGLNPIIDRLIAQLNGPGAVSILEAAERAYFILASLCTIGISSVLLTHLSREAVHGSIVARWKPIMAFVLALCALFGILGIALGNWGLDAFFNTVKALAPAQSALVRRTYWFYLMGMPAIALVITYVRRLQALHRWYVLVVVAVAGVALNIVLSLIFNRWLGVAGIALATSVVNGVLMVFFMVAV